MYTTHTHALEFKKLFTFVTYYKKVGRFVVTLR